MGVREFGAFLREKREERGLKKATLASAVGIVPSYLTRLEAGDPAYKSIGHDVLRRLAAILGVEEEVFEGLLYDRPLPEGPGPDPEPAREVPVYDIGSIAAGPRGRSRVDHWEYVPLSQTRGRILRAAVVSGDCMADEVRPGDTVIFNADPAPRDGALVVAVLLDEGDGDRGKGVLKRFYRLGDKVKLAPNVGEPLILAADRVRIEGVVVEVRRRYPA